MQAAAPQGACSTLEFFQKSTKNTLKFRSKRAPRWHLTVSRIVQIPKVTLKVVKALARYVLGAHLQDPLSMYIYISENSFISWNVYNPDVSRES